MKIAAATIASSRRMALARATARSFARHHPNVPFYVLQADAPHEAIDAQNEPFLLIPYDAVPRAAAAGLHLRYGEPELSYALTPFLAGRLLEAGFDAVLFLKQETLVLASLQPLFDQLERHAVLLTPHLLEPPSQADGARREWNVLRAGIFNGGVVGFRRSEEAAALLEWWSGRCAAACVLDVEQGMHYEQRWLDFFPSLAPGLGIVRDPGINVGHWNLAERRIRVLNGTVTACGVPCRIFRFSGYDPARPDIVSRYAPHLRVRDTGEAAVVFRLYQELLEECGWRECERLPFSRDTVKNQRLATQQHAEGGPRDAARGGRPSRGTS